MSVICVKTIIYLLLYNLHDCTFKLQIFLTENETEEAKSSDDSIIKNKSEFNPVRIRDKILAQNIDSLNSLNFPDLQKAPKNSLSKLEWTAINDLKNDKNIKIEEAEKEGSMVILSKFHYKSMKLLQLNDEKTYKRLNSHPDHTIMNENISLNNNTITHRFKIQILQS